MRGLGKCVLSAVIVASVGVLGCGADEASRPRSEFMGPTRSARSITLGDIFAAPSGPLVPLWASPTMAVLPTVVLLDRACESVSVVAPDEDGDTGVLRFLSSGGVQMASLQALPGAVGHFEHARRTWWGAYLADSVVVIDLATGAFAIVDLASQSGRVAVVPQLTPAAEAPDLEGRAVGVLPTGALVVVLPERIPHGGGTGLRWTEGTVATVRPWSLTVDTVGTIGISQLFWSPHEYRWPVFGARAHFALVGTVLAVAPSDAPSVMVLPLDSTGPDLRVVWQQEPESVRRRHVDQWVEWTESVERARYGGETLRPATILPYVSDALSDGADELWLERYRWAASRVPGPPSDSTRWAVITAGGMLRGTIAVPSSVLVLGVSGTCVATGERGSDGRWRILLNRRLEWVKS